MKKTMTKRLQSVLTPRGKIDDSLLEHLQHKTVRELKSIGKFWIKGVSKMSRDEIERELPGALKTGGAKVVKKLTCDEREILGIVALYGGRLCGEVLSAEICLRGLAPEKKKNDWRTPVATTALTDRLMLISDDAYWGSSEVPNVTLPRALHKHVKPVEPLALSPDKIEQPKKVKSDGMVSVAEAQLRILGVHEFLCAKKEWKLLRGGSLPKGMRTQLAKRFGKKPVPADKMMPPDVDSLDYEILRGLGLVETEVGIPYAYANEDLASIAGMSDEELAWHYVRAWLGARMWQDGIGLVKETVNEWAPERLEFSSVEMARSVLCWGLSRLAQSGLDWVDLESFLIDLHSVTKEKSPRLYTYGLVWKPKFASARGREKAKNEQREKAYWMASEGTWYANAIMVTLHALGAVERGKAGSKHCFRLTENGRLVFGAPTVRIKRSVETPPFVVIQPNFDVVVYLNQADTARLQGILPLMKRQSPVDGEVQTFRLERECVYQALESGLSIDDIRTRLEKCSREPVPAVVDRALGEWSGKHESLVLRKEVCVVLFGGKNDRKVARTRALGDRCLLAPGSAAATVIRAFPGAHQSDHRGPMEVAWELDEKGKVTPAEGAPALIPTLRLKTIAQKARGCWKITPDSVRKAARAGIPADVITAWLQDHGASGVPLLLATAIANWARADKCFSGKIHVVQMNSSRAFEAVCGSRLFAKMIAGTIDARWIVFHPEHVTAANRLLEFYGFSLAGEMKLDDVMRNTAPTPGSRKEVGAEIEVETKGRRTARKKRKRKKRGLSKKARELIAEAQRRRWSERGAKSN